MAISDVTKPMALDETLQSTNTALGSLGKDTTLQAIATAIANVGLSNIGNMSSLATTDKTSLVSAINEVVGDVSDLDTDKADKVASATNGNLAGLNGSGNLTDSGVAASEIPALWKSQGEYGVKNLNSYPYYETNHTDHTVVWTDNGDGTITVNGTAKDGASSFICHSRISGRTNELLVPNGRYIVTGCPSDGANNKYRVTCTVTKNGSASNLGNDYGDGVEITVDGDDYYSDKAVLQIGCDIMTGYAATNLTFRPMLRLAADTDETYRPYAKTNKQLTDEVGENTEDVDTLKNRADKTTTSISGNPISITGLKSNQLAVNPVITFEPIQAGSGDPSPSNVRAISGYDKIEVLSCGKNLVDLPNKIMTGGGWALDLLPCKLKAGTYTFSLAFTGTANQTQVQFKAADQTTVVGTVMFNLASGQRNSASVTLSAECEYVRYYVNAAGSYTNYQIELGTTATTYEPYHKTTDLSENLPQTVYGGSLDVRTGKLTGTYDIVDLGNLDWGYASPDNLFRATVTGMKVVTAASDRTKGIVCSCYAISSSATVNYQYMDDKSMLRYNGAIVIKNTDYTDATAFKTAMAGQKLAFEVATPFTIQLTPHEISLLKDYAYVSTNGTSIALDYHNGEMASLSDVSQLGETVNLLSFRQISLLYYFGNVTIDNSYDYDITNDYPLVTSDTLKMISLSMPYGSSGTDSDGVVHWRISSGHVVATYVCKRTQNNARCNIRIFY